MKMASEKGLYISFISSRVGIAESKLSRPKVASILMNLELGTLTILLYSAPQLIWSLEAQNLKPTEQFGGLGRL
ncbi:unnamed protein product [marine sediment metagenome]|uniref:Uncharacterized protein n=1 Tax=marine sediment metagenome TaxID=412755 RepID=X1SZ47_9ZZZZ